MSPALLIQPFSERLLAASLTDQDRFALLADPGTADSLFRHLAAPEIAWCRSRLEVIHGQRRSIEEMARFEDVQSSLLRAFSSPLLRDEANTRIVLECAVPLLSERHTSGLLGIFEEMLPRLAWTDETVETVARWLLPGGNSIILDAVENLFDVMSLIFDENERVLPHLQRAIEMALNLSDDEFRSAFIAHLRAGGWDQKKVRSDAGMLRTADRDHKTIRGLAANPTVPASTIF